MRITGYSPAYAADFARLNYQWIEQYFRIEDEDRTALDHPEACLLYTSDAADE